MQLQTNRFDYIPPPPLPIEDSSLNKTIIDEKVHSHQSQISPSNLKESYLQAKRYTEKEDWQRAINAYEKVISFLPRDTNSLAEIYRVIAVCYFKLGENEKALSQFKKAAKICPTNYEIYLGLGLVYLLLGKNVKAIQSLREAIKLNEKEGEIYFYLGYLYAAKNQWNLAITHYGQAIKLNKEFEPSYSYLADLYFELGQKNPSKSEGFYLEAIKVYEGFTKINTNNLAVLNNLGLLYSLINRFDVALHYYQKALEIEPSSEVVQKNYLSLKNALVKLKLLRKGSIERIPEPITDFTPYKNRKLFQVKGEPLSQTIIEERR